MAYAGFVVLFLLTGGFLWIALDVAYRLGKAAKFLVWTVLFAVWLGIAALTFNVSGFWGTTHWRKAQAPNWLLVLLGVGLCAFVFGAPVWFVLSESWNTRFTAIQRRQGFSDRILNEMTETQFGFLYAASLLIGFLVSQDYGFSYWWAFLSSLPLLLILLCLYLFLGAIFCHLALWFGRSFDRKKSPPPKKVLSQRRRPRS